MRTPKRLYAHERVIYQPELLTCPHCGDLLVMCNYLAWDKTVQMLDRVLSVASRPGCCRHATCAGSRMRLLSAEGQRLALPGSTYGYDVLVRIGWWRQEYRATYREIHAELAAQVRISVSHVGYLYQQVYLPLLACHERQHRDHLAQIAKQQGGLIVALDGLAPQGGEPQIWFIRELSRGLTLRSGWLCRNRSGSDNLTLAIRLPQSIPCYHGNTTGIPPRGVGTDPIRSASLYSGTGSTAGGIGSHGAGVTRAQPHVAGAADPNLAEFFTSPFERSATTRTSTPSSESAPSRWSTGAPWPYANPDPCGRG